MPDETVDDPPDCGLPSEETEALRVNQELETAARTALSVLRDRMLSRSEGKDFLPAPFEGMAAASCCTILAHCAESVDYMSFPNHNDCLMFSEAFKIEFNQELVGMNYLRVVPLADRLATVFAMQRPTVDWVSVRDALIKWVERLDREKAEGQSATSQTPAPAEAAGNVQPAKVKAQAPATRKLMPDRFRRAWESYRFAADRVPDAKDQKALHEYLKEHGCEQYGGEGKPSLPDFRTWQRYYRDGRDWHKRIFSEIRDSQKR